MQGTRGVKEGESVTKKAAIFYARIIDLWFICYLSMTTINNFTYVWYNPVRPHTLNGRLIPFDVRYKSQNIRLKCCKNALPLQVVNNLFI